MTASLQPPSPRARWALYLTFLAFSIIAIYVGERFFENPRAPIRTTTYLLLLAVGVWALLGPKPLLARLARRAEMDPAQSARVLHIRSILQWCRATSIVLWGVCVRSFGGSRLEAVPFYVIGCLLLLAGRPAELTELSPSAPSE